MDETATFHASDLHMLGKGMLRKSFKYTAVQTFGVSKLTNSEEVNGYQQLFVYPLFSKYLLFLGG